MVIISSGPLSLSAVAAEYGDATPHALTEYYRDGGAGLVKTNATTGAVPTSGTFAMTNLYGTRKMVTGTTYSNLMTLTGSRDPYSAGFTNNVAVPANSYITKVTSSFTNITGYRDDTSSILASQQQGPEYWQWVIQNSVRISIKGITSGITYRSSTYNLQSLMSGAYPTAPYGLTFNNEWTSSSPLWDSNLGTRVFTGASGDSLRVELECTAGAYMSGKCQLRIFYEY